MRALILTPLLLLACDGDDAPAAGDAQPLDAAVTDAHAPDATPDAADVSPPDAEAPDATPADAGPRVLLVGNSYTAANRLDRLLAERLGPAAEVQAVTRGGYRLDQHAADAQGDTPLGRALRDEAWDVVVLQQQSQIAGFPQAAQAWQAMRDGAETLRDLAQAGGATVWVFETWGRRDGDAQNPERYPDFATMQGHLSAGYRALSDQLDLELTPVGQAFGQIHAAAPEPVFRALYSADGSHPSPVGSALAACVIGVSLGAPVGLPTSVETDDAAALEAACAAVSQ